MPPGMTGKKVNISGLQNLTDERIEAQITMKKIRSGLKM
jgi:hypothetical protein